MVIVEDAEQDRDQIAGAHIHPEAQAGIGTRGDIAIGAIPGVQVHRDGVRSREKVTLLSAPNTDAHGQIVIEKLTKNVNEDHLREIFSAYGDIQSLELPMNRQCNPPSYLFFSFSTRPP
ncbi:hypothetical protein PRK78_004907 [Emydomyces testavorans]|uniref:RRM domain-containing protein n=1 Tax=Emydomyces testavorans TaxID=2070801 RepID=A0AAF0DJH1_9EURO|nr:hypothetical protein PRK78_004907 [Emydomyces testavorans]